ncbi:hypothetical protein ACFCX4_20750 [Kitasatospora sp. NPDC056327]|uniref:hypothetical protein n=1 Tax=Kitasatospora sp. NPDC056327 TaxID=3345785 RepID=UPI0035DA07E9
MTRTPGRRPRALLRVALAASALALAAGCATPGELRDHGTAEPVTPPVAKVPLWPGRATAPPPSPPGPTAGRTPEPPPQEVPDITVPGQDITAVDVHALLDKDPGVSQDERRALEPCDACEVRDPVYRDLTGDGRPELLVAVGTGEAFVLHVYTASDGRLRPVLRAELPKVFGAETVGTGLWLSETTTISLRTSRLYQWDGVRLVLADQRVEGIGPVPQTAPPDPEATMSAAERKAAMEKKAAAEREAAAQKSARVTPPPGSSGGAPVPQPVVPTLRPTGAPAAQQPTPTSTPVVPVRPETKP